MRSHAQMSQFVSRRKIGAVSAGGVFAPAKWHCYASPIWAIVQMPTGMLFANLGVDAL